MPEPGRVLVVGAGPAGLATSQQLRARAVPHRVLERGAAVGHTWANLYDSLTLHTGKHMSSLPGMPFPHSAPLFVPRREFLEYLRRYALAFDLPVETGHAVERVIRTDGSWTVRTSRGEYAAGVLVVATGIVANPRIPALPGRQWFGGRVVHSVEYRRPDPYRGRRVLVVGVGNSGAEIGSEIARAGGKVTIAVRSGANVVPLTLAGLPIQYVSYWVRKLPRTIQEGAVGLVRLLTGVHVTDTSSGFRAMRAEITGKVRQEQVQYQTSELLIGAIYHGYRIAERPIVMHKRTAGESKKGNNILYGFRYARVIVRTWWRERRNGRPVAAPALEADDARG